MTKEISHLIWEYKGSIVPPHSTKHFQDLSKYLQVPICPPTLSEVCKVIELYYILKVSLGREKSGESVDMEFALDVATVPFRIPSIPSPELKYGTTLYICMQL